MSEGLLVVAVGAGMLAAVNPCGFALLPAYVSLLLAGSESLSRPAAARRAAALSIAMTSGFAGVFVVFGLVISPVAGQLQRHLPWFTVVLGATLALMGVWLVAGRTLSLPRLGRSSRSTGARPLTRSFWSMTGFGASYAIASISCTIAPFLAVVVGGFRSGSVLEGLTLFVAYAVGMGLVVGTLALATVFASPTTIGRLRGAGRWAPRAAGALLAAAGSYVAYYGWWELRVLAGEDPDDPVIDAAASLQQQLARLVDSIGPLGWLTAGALLLLAALVTRRRARGARNDLAMGERAGR
ncbi:cytochrome c biogenesis CcdA family protein [Nocardioides sp. AX2bis]|uniref:cytochrome c biogenesis CcdA family protein n=1 Tax=Nocardioides sp. AX2bis TaxID=2653157 RepID=UPI0012F406B2|nr:cytochrome c biogenesis CcdA family protein [Nocardioides sp. AX2bis]VXB08528.1 Cytochrome C biogenesis protein transmembrane region [Nocardioides sp. AX2bis]